MKIPFMLKFPWGEETHFIEKLWATAYYYNLLTSNLDLEKYTERAPLNVIMPTENRLDICVCKLHTIRHTSTRFKEGQYVQPYVWSDKPYRSKQFDFMPPLKILGKQDFKIGGHHGGLWPFVNEIELSIKDCENLAINDGFKDEDQFFKYFNKPVEEMEIRHFTNLKY